MQGHSLIGCLQALDSVLVHDYTSALQLHGLLLVEGLLGLAKGISSEPEHDIDMIHSGAHNFLHGGSPVCILKHPAAGTLMSAAMCLPAASTVVA